MSYSLGIMGLGTMGSALAENFASKGVSVSLWNRSSEKATQFVRAHVDWPLYASQDFEDFIESLEKPRRVLVMLPAGEATTEAMARLKAALEDGDSIFDGANAFFKDTEQFQSDFMSAGIHYVGAGVSGGEEGARRGPSIMPGGTTYSWELWKPLLEKISARDFHGQPCVAHMGRGGAGHYVKMVHNGIEYAEMEVLAETFDLLHRGRGDSYESLAQIFKNYSEGPLASFLMDISVEVLEKIEEGQPLLELILDQAGQKGTGKWTTEECLNLGVAAPSFASAVFMRGLSENPTLRQQRAKASPVGKVNQEVPEDFSKILAEALMLTRLVHFEQGFELLRKADETYEFGLDFASISRVWQGGCIIRSKVLADIEAHFVNGGVSLYDGPLPDDSALRTVVQVGTALGIPVLGFASALTHFEAARTARLPAHFIQGLRDNFGSHGYERIDQPGHFHSNWS